MTTKGRKEVYKSSAYRITTQKSKSTRPTFKGRIRVKSTKGSRRGTRR